MWERRLLHGVRPWAIQFFGKLGLGTCAKISGETSGLDSLPVDRACSHAHV